MKRAGERKSEKIHLARQLSCHCQAGNAAPGELIHRRCKRAGAAGMPASPDQAQKLFKTP